MGIFLDSSWSPPMWSTWIVRRQEIVQLGDAGVAQHRQDARQVALAGLPESMSSV
jgi:hypothetical protein